MSLLILPIDTEGSDGRAAGHRFSDGEVRVVLTQFLSRVKLSSGELSLDTRPPEPAMVIARRVEDWQTPQVRPLVERGQVLVPERGSIKSGERAFQELLRSGLEQVARHDAIARSCADRSDLDEPGLIIVPVLVLRDPISPEDRRAAVAQLEGIAKALDETTRELAKRGVGGASADKSSILSRIQMKPAVVPWIFSPGGMDAGDLGPAFSGVRELGVKRMSPVIYSGVTKGGEPIRWRGQGQVRLMADLHFLHALSASEKMVDRVFRSRYAEDPELITLHSSIFEFPLRERLERAALEQLVGTTLDTASRVLPDSQELGTVMQEYLGAESPRAEAMCQEVHAVVEKKPLESTHYYFGGQGTHKHASDKFTFPSRPDFMAWQEYITDDQWRLITPPRQVDELHDKYLGAMQACLDSDYDVHLQEAIKSTVETKDQLLGDLETALRRTLKGQEKGEASAEEVAMEMGAVARSPTVEGVGRTLALLGAMRGKLSVYDEKDQALPDAERALNDLMALRPGWISKEQSLLTDGLAVPSLGGFTLVELSVALVGVGAMLSMFYLVFPAVGIALAALIFLWVYKRRYQRARAAYFERWGAAEESFMKAASVCTERIPAAINARVRQIKVMIARDLLRSLDAARARFETEVKGFSKLVKDDLAVMQLRDREQMSVVEHAMLGRFRVVPEEAPHEVILRGHAWVLVSASGRALESFRDKAEAEEKLEKSQSAQTVDTASQTELHRRLTSVWSRSLTLRSIPEQISMAEYRAMLESLRPSTDNWSSSGDPGLVAQTTQMFERAQKHAVNLERTSKVTVRAGQDTKPETFMLFGPALRDRVDADSARASLSEHDTYGPRHFFFLRGGKSTGPTNVASDERHLEAVARAVPDELAIIHALRRHPLPSAGEVGASLG